MDACCESKTQELSAQRGAFGRVLWIVLAINAVMFGVEFSAGLLANSTALMADSLDMFGDAGVYAVSLAALSRSARWRAGASLLKSGAMAALGLAILVNVVLKVLAGTVPHAATVTSIGALALAANLACAVLLVRFRNGEINMRSTWLCSRNDVLANLGVLVAGVLVAATGSLWPDVLVGAAIAAVNLLSASTVLRESIAAWSAAAPAHTA